MTNVTEAQIALKILEDTKSFYANSWDHLILFVAFFAGVIPLIIYLLDKRALSLNKQELENHSTTLINNQLKSFNIGLEKKFKKLEDELNDKHKKATDKLNKELFNHEANAFHIQGAQSFSDEEYASSVISYNEALHLRLKGENYSNIIITTENIFKCLEMLKHEDMNVEINDNFSRLKEKISEYDKNNLLDQFKTNLDKKLESLNKEKPKD